MTDTSLPGLLLTGTHAGRPAASTVGGGTLYAETDTGQIFQSDGSSWSAWSSAAVAAGAVTTSGLTMATARMLGRTTASTGAIEEITVGTGLSLSAGSLTATGSGGITKIATAFVKRTAGDLSITDDTSYHDVPTIGDLTIAAATSDVLEFTLGAVADQAIRYEIELPTSGNYVGPGVTSTQGIASFANRTAGAGNSNGAIMYTVQSGDISGGNVLCRLRYSTNSSGATKIFASTAVGPLFFGVKNLLH